MPFSIFWMLIFLWPISLWAQENAGRENVTHYAPGAVYEVKTPPQALPSYLERKVEFMWMENSHIWKDRFRARLYPRQPVVGVPARINLNIRRYRDKKVKGKPDPLKIEVFIRRSDGGELRHDVYKRPGPSISFDYTFEYTGAYVISLITYYAEKETYTVTLRFQVVPQPDPDPTEPKEVDLPGVY